jgi:hypothetical protein
MGLRGSEQRFGGRSVKEVRVCISSLSRGRYRAVVPLAEIQERGSKGLCEGVRATTLNPRGVALMRQARDDRIVFWQLMRKVVSRLGRSVKVVSEK